MNRESQYFETDENKESEAFSSAHSSIQTIRPEPTQATGQG
jgi:hypothetical protein